MNKQVTSGAGVMEDDPNAPAQVMPNDAGAGAQAPADPAPADQK
jgi:hypothetical protein